jgi:hypothetical protein
VWLDRKDMTGTESKGREGGGVGLHRVDLAAVGEGGRCGGVFLGRGRSGVGWGGLEAGAIELCARR